MLVYARRKRVPEGGPEYRGVNIVYVPTIYEKHLETLVHAFLSTLDVLRKRPDAVLMCNGANALFCWIPRLFGIPVALNVDGIERKRKKWGPLARLWYRFGEWLSKITPTFVIADADVIADYYEDRYGMKTVCIPYLSLIHI